MKVRHLSFRLKPLNLSCLGGAPTSECLSDSCAGLYTCALSPPASSSRASPLQKNGRSSRIRSLYPCRGSLQIESDPVLSTRKDLMYFGSLEERLPCACLCFCTLLSTEELVEAMQTQSDEPLRSAANSPGPPLVHNAHAWSR